MGSASSVVRVYMTSKNNRSLNGRGASIILGSLLADAACMGLQWIYCQDHLFQLSDGGFNIYFFEPPQCPYYSFESGTLSSYGEEILPFLRSIANNNCFSAIEAANATFEFFQSREGYVSSLVNEFLQHREEGKDWAQCSVEDNFAHGLVKVPLICVRYAGSPELVEKIRESVSVLQSSSLPMDASVLLGLLIERLLFTSETPNEALKHLYYNSPVLNPEKKEGVSNRTLDWNHKQVQESTPYQTSETNLQSQSVNVEYMKHIIHFILHCKLINHWVHLTEILANIETFSSTDSDGQFETHSNKQPSIDDVIHKTNLQMKLFEQVLTERTVVLRQEFEFQLTDEESLLYDKLMHLKDTNVIRMRNYSTEEILFSLGISASLPGALLCILYIASQSDEYEEALKMNVLCGGDVCCRAIVLGGIFAAKSSGMNIREDWYKKMRPELLKELSELSLKVAGSNPNLEDDDIIKQMKVRISSLVPSPSKSNIKS